MEQEGGNWKEGQKVGTGRKADESAAVSCAGLITSARSP